TVVHGLQLLRMAQASSVRAPRPQLSPILHSATNTSFE
ncbi:hypothetical protein LCGC14_2369090, partial [marine sediment metagenome]